MTRRKTGEAGQQTASAPPGPAGAADNAAILAKLDAILTEQHELRRLVHRMAVVTETITIDEAARRLFRSRRSVENLAARQVFTDGRPPDKRVRGSPLVFYADEIEVYRSDGEAGVARLRKELGRR